MTERIHAKHLKPGDQVDLGSGFKVITDIQRTPGQLISHLTLTFADGSEGETTSGAVVTVNKSEGHFQFWKDNKKDGHFTLKPQELKVKLKAYLATKDRSWVEYYRAERVIRSFITDADGLSSVFDESQFEAIYDTLAPTIFSHLKSTK